ncbi:hypothetical protein LCGC14_1329780 [marine sediment metagenome]|uniref:Uncharacterized protein n=1 Tax=marine sediment metagenome TaxID=412755 RepID=A0A0F9KGZ2_9ZZZZ
MRKIEFGLIVIVLLVLSFVICGCQEVSKPDLRRQLMTLRPDDQAKWNEKYGDSLKSQLTANILLVIQVLNKQGEAMKQLDSRLVKLEDPNE